MNVLIIGGGGLCGQAIAKKHIAQGDTVYIYDSRVNSYNDYSNLVGEDLSQVASWESIIRDYTFDIISTQMAFVGVGESQYEISKYVLNNIGFLSQLLQFILHTKKFPKLIIHASSMGGYGEGLRICPMHGAISIENLRTTVEILCPSCNSNTYSVATHEEIEMFPKSYYAITKKTQEEMLKVFSELYNVPVVALRYFSVYGIESNPRNPFTGVLSVIGNKILNSSTISLNEDGDQTRDLICSDDIADAHYVVSREWNKGFIAVNVGTGKSVSLNYVAQTMIDILESNKIITHNHVVRKGDIRDMCADITKMKNTFNWVAKVSIDTGIEKYCNYLQNNYDKFVGSDTTAQADSELKKRGLL